jgi:hypothetical protein
VPSGNEYSGKVTLTVNKLLQFPVLTLKIKADWLGVYVPVGKPLITSVSSTEFQTGGVSYITTKVKNIGDALGSFGVYAQCNQPFSFVGTTEFINLNPNEEGVVNLKISGTCSQKIQGSCNVYAYDRNNPNNKDSKTVSVSCTPIVLCNAGETRCNGKVIEQCNQAGSGWNAIQTCDYTCEIKEGKATCVSPPPPKPQCEWWDIGCWVNNIFKNIGDWIKLNILAPLGLFFILIVIVLIVLFVFGIIGGRRK